MISAFSIKDKKAALFDLGSTLIEYENLPWPKLYQLCLKRSCDFLASQKITVPPWQEFHSAFLETVIEEEQESRQTMQEKNIYVLFRKLLSRFDIILNNSLLQAFLAWHYQPIRENISVVPDALEVLQFFKQRGYRLGLISNTIFPPDYHFRDLAQFGLAGFFDRMLFSSAFPYRKPHPAIFERMLRELDIPATSAFFVGDKVEIDIAGARKAGLVAVLLKKSQRADDGKDAPDLIIESLSMLIDYC